MKLTTTHKKILLLGFLISLGIYNILEATEQLSYDKSKERKIKIIGDILQVVIPIIAVSYPILKDDVKAQQDFLKTMFNTFAVTHILKHSVNATRPNGGNRSFPSGHTSSAFQGATFIHNNLGSVPSGIAYLGASFVGFSRVYTKKHHTVDVVFGALIGYLMTSSKKPNIAKIFKKK